MKSDVSGTHTIVEHSSKEGVPLTRREAVALNALRLTTVFKGRESKHRVLRVEPEGDPDLYTVSAYSVVGAVKIGDTQISITPKIGVGKTALMLAYSLGDVTWRSEDVEQDSGDLVEALVRPFLDDVERLITQGLAESYVEREEIGSRPRGSIDFSWSNVGMPLPIRYRFDDFSNDIPENRLLRSALECILTVEGLSRLGGARAMQALDAFGGVGPSRHEDLYVESFIARYDRPLDFARLIIRNAGIEPDSGGTTSTSLLFDMNRVFENFVCSVVRSHFMTLGRFVDLQGEDRPRFMTASNRLKVHPDFAIWSGQQCELVGDVKYKLFSGAPKRPDLYQAVAYAQTCGTNSALLLYAGTGRPRTVLIEASQVTVTSSPLDIEHIPQELLVSEVVHLVSQALIAAGILAS